MHPAGRRPCTAARHAMHSRRALEEAQSLAVQQGEVAKLTQRQLEAAQLQVTTLTRTRTLALALTRT